MSSLLPSLHLYNSESRQVEAFTPIEAGKVKLYVCGPTVYNDAHLGHARCYITWDVLFRLLQSMAYEVTYARNLTDVDDKIINRAKEEGQSPEAIATLYTQRFHEDLARLNTLKPTIEPKATEHIPAMQDIIQTLIEKSHAYLTSDGVYFSTESMPHYGRLARKPIEALQAGARVDVNTEKKHPSDFALWKFQDESQEAYGWSSPWGFGRPGWHIECSAMIFSVLGQRIDIHAGGADLIFPHHENEIAQSECCSGHTFVNMWMHNGFVNVDGEKMSKSLGNFSTVRDLLEHYDANTLRYFMLGHHYRMPVDFTPEALNAAKARMQKLLQQVANALQKANLQANWLDAEIQHLSETPPLMKDIVEVSPLFVEGLCQDMNTPRALAEWGNAFKALKHASESEDIQACLRLILKQADLLGFDVSPASAYLKPVPMQNGTQNGEEGHQFIGISTEEMPDLRERLEVRRMAKQAKDFQTSDAIRQDLEAMGYTLTDRAGGWMTLERKPL